MVRSNKSVGGHDDGGNTSTLAGGGPRSFVPEDGHCRRRA
jgi:hypothetical protein